MLSTCTHWQPTGVANTYTCRKCSNGKTSNTVSKHDCSKSVTCSALKGVPAKWKSVSSCDACGTGSGSNIPYLALNLGGANPTAKTPA